MKKQLRTETIVVPVRVRKEPAYALAVKIYSKNGVVIKVLHNLLDGKPAYFGQAALETVLGHLGRGALIDQRLAPSDAEIEGLRRERMEAKFEEDFVGHEWRSDAEEHRAMRVYGLYCIQCGHGLGCEHGVPAPYYGPEFPFLRGKYGVFGTGHYKATLSGEEVFEGDVNYPLMRTDNYAFAKRMLRKLQQDSDKPEGYYIYPDAACPKCGQEEGKNPLCWRCTHGWDYPETVLPDEEVGIFQERQTVHVERYALSYNLRNEPGYGFSFPCNKEGNVLTEQMAPEGLENLEKCRSGEYDVECEGVVDESYDYRQVALLRCYCGATVELHDPLTNTCGDCERRYNMSGQLLAVPSQWDCDCAEYCY